MDRMHRSVGMVVALAALAAGGGAPLAAGAGVIDSCVTYCHSMPPSDGARSGSTVATPTNAAFRGNHTTHAASAASSCEKCHPGSASYGFDHMSSAGKPVIRMSANINASPVAATYARAGGSGVFLNQTSVPPLGSCAGTNCHFEQTTPAWGSALYASPADCGSCHQAPPAGGAGGSAGSHTRHELFFPGASRCELCHPDHLAAPSPFAHATSAGRRGILVTLSDPAGVASGAYSGSGANFLPSQGAAQLFGSCSANYCHSGGQSATGLGAGTAVTVAWGGAAPGCGGCHRNYAGDAAATGNHAKHAQSAQIACSTCHGASYSSTSAPAAAGSSHVNKSIDLGFTGVAAGTAYSKGTGFAAGSAPYGSCSASYCHSTVQGATGLGAGTAATPAWGGGALSCGACHKNMSTDATPPGSHALHCQAAGTVYGCNVCHGTGFSATAVVYPPHVDNAINLSFTANAAGTSYSKGSSIVPGSALYGSCGTSNCHGAGNPAWGANTGKARCSKCHGFRSTPWNALNGGTATSDARAGAHFNHISSAGSLKFSRPFGCAECHALSIALATDSVNAAGHFDTAAPSELSFSPLARTGGVSPSYTTGQCANVYCHGAGMASNVSNPPASRVASPSWSAPFLGTASVVGNGSSTPGSGDCARCHGYPPMTATHAGVLATDCIGCHSHVNASGTGFSDPTKHLNGVLEASGGHAVPFYNHQSAGTGGSCTGCHAVGSAASVYPAAVLGNAPDCRGCHRKGAPGTATGGSAVFGACGSCHGSLTATTALQQGRPNGTAFPDEANRHSSPTDHRDAACTKCHILTTSGTGTTVNHGRGDRDANPNIVGPGFITGISLTPVRGVAPAVSCNHDTVSANNGGGCSGVGTETW